MKLEAAYIKRMRVFPTLGHSSFGQSSEVNTSLGKMVVTGFRCIRGDIPDHTAALLLPALFNHALVKLHHVYVNPRRDEAKDFPHLFRRLEVLERKSIP